MKKMKFKPTYIVDITECENFHDVAVAFAKTKHKAGLPLTDNEMDTLFIDPIMGLLDVLENVGAIVRTGTYSFDAPVVHTTKEEKKDPWYKRFFNWLFRKNKR